MVRVIKFLFSGVFMGILLISFAVAIGYATLVENDFDATTARLFVYNAWWFEVLILLMVVNFAGMIFTKKLYVKSRINILVVHLALIIIILGAATTRYQGFEGMMHIRNGETVNTLLTTANYMSIDVSSESEQKSLKQEVLVSAFKDGLYRDEFMVNGKKMEIGLKRYLPNAIKRIVTDPNGRPTVHLIVGGSDGRHDLILQEGATQTLHGIEFSFGESSNTKGIQVTKEADSLYLKMPLEMKTNEDGTVTISKGTTESIELMSVQSYRDIQFLVKDYQKTARIDYVPVSKPGAHTVEAVVFQVNDQEISGGFGEVVSRTIDGIDLNLYVGPQEIQLPFAIRLNQFRLERYPGSRSPSSFTSDILLIDEDAGIEEPHRIFMNNILEYKGYRFYQSSYDQDEKGTILSVNSDYWGTRITYLGYFLLFASLILSFFTKNTRFRSTLRQMHEIREKRQQLLPLILLFSCFILGAQVAKAQEIDQDHASEFGRLVVQGHDGRMMPLNTLAEQLMVKVHKRSTYKELSAEQVLLSMMLFPSKWESEPFIRVNHEEVQGLLDLEDQYARYADFFNERGQYLLQEHTSMAYNQKPALRNEMDKELIKVSERINIFYNLLNGLMLNVLPIPDDPNDTWTARSIYGQMALDDPKLEPLIFEQYLSDLRSALSTSDYSNAQGSLESLSKYQRLHGKKIVPSERKINAEIVLNRSNIFKRLFPVYLLTGIVLVILFFIQLLKPTVHFRRMEHFFFWLLVVAFVLQTMGLILRWYVSDHAPWSNGYESMIYISWATVLAGFIFMGKSPITLGLTAILSGITLLTAHMSWMDPQITNLAPVLKSYWLTIHVAAITASYGFLGLASLLGFFNLLLMIFKNSRNFASVQLTLKELTHIIEIALMCGLTLLIIGNFLGAIWANESWGRYWGWDPKETWTLITIVVYSFILHLSLIPKLKNLFITNVLSLLGFSSILMTYFGVNFYLSGLHSYASGDPVPVPGFVYYTLMVIGFVSIIAAYKEISLRHHRLES